MPHDTVQHLIYFFTDAKVRRRVLDKAFATHQPRLVQWGTFYAKEDKMEHTLLQKLRDKMKAWLADVACQEAAFTICISYGVRSVHFVAVVLQKADKSGSIRVVSFDSGSNLYPHGERVVLPALRRVLRTLTRHVSHVKTHVGVCPHHVSTPTTFRHRRFGLQFDASTVHRLPADAFCQCWSLFFLVEWAMREGEARTQHGAFARQWCQIPPQDRRAFLLRSFILPALAQDGTLRRWFVERYDADRTWVDLHTRSMQETWMHPTTQRHRHAAAAASGLAEGHKTV